MRVLIIGGTGFIGKELIKVLNDLEHQVTVLSRDMSRAKSILGNDINVIDWDTLLNQTIKIEDYEAIINLVGESIGDGRWTKSRKEAIISSRTDTTKMLVDAIKNNRIKPKVLINASAIGYYGPRNDEKLTENALAGNDFLAEVSKAWEEEAKKAEEFNVRVVLLRIGLVLGKGGALAKMLLPYKLYAGGSMGSGKQWMSWIHIKDLTGIIGYILEKETINGPVNGTAPNPVQMKEFSKAIGKVMGKPSWFTVPGPVLRVLLGEMADMLLTGQRVSPQKISNAGYEFKYPNLTPALEDILNV